MKFKPMFQLSGRVGRGEYWALALGQPLVGLVLTAVVILVTKELSLAGPTVAGAFAVMVGILLQLALTWMAFCVTTKRLHDTNRSAWWQLLSLFGCGVYLFGLVEVLMKLPGAPALFIVPGGTLVLLAHAPWWVHAVGGSSLLTVAWLVACQRGDMDANDYGAPRSGSVLTQTIECTRCS